jgi:protein-S-isoprenylcysteine O-methyltransferase Ste14
VGRLGLAATAAGAQLALGVAAASIAAGAAFACSLETDVIVILCAVVAGLDASAQSGDDAGEIPMADRALAAVTSAGVATAFLGAAAESAVRGGGVPPLWFAIGVVIALAGALLRARAIRVLGRGFITAARPVAHERCVRDVYAYLRHPSEIGLLVCLAGVAMTSRATSAGVGLVTAAATSLLRMKREGGYLQARYPSNE